MSALRMAELIVRRCKERTAANHAAMDRGVDPEQYMKLVGRNAALKELQTETQDFLKQVEGEELDD